MSQELVFGVGSCWAIPSTDITGASISNPTPTKFGVLQDLTVSIEFPVKELISRYQLPIAAARSGAKITWSAKFAQINMGLFHMIYFGTTGQPTAGAHTVADSEAQTVPGSPYAQAVTNASAFERDLGVRYSSSGNVLVKPWSAPGTGQYQVGPSGAPDFAINFPYNKGDYIKPLTSNAGGFIYMALAAGTSPGSAPTWTQTSGATVTSTPNWLAIGPLGTYLFAAGDTGLAMLIDYVYVATFGYRTTFISQNLGNAPTFGIVARGVYSGAPMSIRLDNCISGKLSIPRKVDDWVIEQMDGEAFIGGNGQAGFFSFNNAL